MASTIEKTIGTGGDYASLSAALSACDWSLGSNYKITAISACSTYTSYSEDQAGLDLTIDFGGFKTPFNSSTMITVSAGSLTITNGWVHQLSITAGVSTLYPTIVPVIHVSKIKTNNSFYLKSDSALTVDPIFYVDNCFVGSDFNTSSYLYNGILYLEDITTVGLMSIGSRGNVTVYPNRLYSRGTFYGEKSAVALDMTESGCSIWADSSYSHSNYYQLPSGHLVSFDNDNFYSVMTDNKLYNVPRTYGKLDVVHNNIPQTINCPHNTNITYSGYINSNLTVGADPLYNMIDPPSGLTVDFTTGDENVKVSWDAPQTGHDSTYSNVGVYWLKNDIEEAFQRSAPAAVVSGLTTTSVNLSASGFMGWDKYYFRVGYLNPND